MNRLQDENMDSAKVEHPDLVAVAAEAGIVADILSEKFNLQNEVNLHTLQILKRLLVNALHQANGLEEAFLQQPLYYGT